MTRIQGKGEEELDALGLELPPPPSPAANYVPFVVAGPLIQLAGVAPIQNGSYAVVGKIGDDLNIEDGRRAARICALNLLANLKLACGGDLDRVKRFVMIRGFVNATAEFERVPFIIDAASDLIVNVFGAQVGQHARTSIGCATLPARVAVELDALVLVHDGNAWQMGASSKNTLPAFAVDYGLKGKCSIVCASSSGLGFACAYQLAQAGCTVVINGRDSEKLSQAAQRIERDTSQQVIPVGGDVGDPAVQQALVASVPQVDILVNNNGGPAHRRFEELDRNIILDGMQSNLITPFELVRLTIDGMVDRRYGRIINITSIAVAMPLPGLDVSSAARAGLTALLAGLARTVAHANVTINSLLPGAFATARILDTIETAARCSGEPIEDVRRRRERGIPADRLGLPEELGAACCFLSSMQAGFITGQNIRIDGGSYPGIW